MLRHLPATLDETYDRILSSIPEESWEIARSALMLLTHSVRPLSLEELAEGMVIDYQRQSFEKEDHRLTSPLYVLDICSSLVSVSTITFNANENVWLWEKNEIERRMHSFGKTLDVVQFAHFSVKEYMMLERAQSRPKVSRFGFSSIAAHQAIASLSLVYLLDFSGGIRLHLSRDTFDAFPFLAYAAQYWPEHWRRQLPLESQETISGLIQRILDTEEEQSAYINYINICDPDATADSASIFRLYGGQAKSLHSIPQPLYYAAQLGHRQLCQWLMDERGCDVNAVGGKFGQAIQAAARFGHKEVVDFLLDRGADIDKDCGQYASPLQAAAYGGHIDVLKPLLDRGAAVNAFGGKLGTALIAACDQGHFDAARLLLDHGADLGFVCEDEGKALNMGARTGNKALVQLLLHKGADIDDPCGGEGSALYSAADCGHLDLVKMLVAEGANVNLRSGLYETSPLQAACGSRKQKQGKHREKYFQIAKFLLKDGADPNLHGGYHGDALQAAVVASARGNAVENNNIDTVRLLLDNKADINYRGGEYHSSIRACMYCGNISAAHLLIDRGVELDDEIFLLSLENQRKTVIPRLLEKGVGVNAQNEAGTALQLAIKNKDAATTNHLLSHPDIDVNALGKTDDGITALYQAVRMRNKEVAKQLLVLGADVNLPSDRTTCLAMAVWNKDMEMIQLLLDHGANINANLPGVQTALMAACRDGSEAVAKFLLDHGANADLWVQRKGDALQAAAWNGSESIAKLLLAHGADIKAPEGDLGSALECAFIADNPALARFLLDAGAPVNCTLSRDYLRENHFGVGGPLLASIGCKQSGLTQLLIERGADVNWPSFGFPGTPLQQAIKRDDEEAFKLILARGADVNIGGGEYGSPLCDAINHQNEETRDKYIGLLLAAGAHVNLPPGREFISPLGVSEDQFLQLHGYQRLNKQYNPDCR